MKPTRTTQEAEEFQQLFDKYYRLVANYFARRGCSREESQDLTQETFMSVYRGMSAYRKDANIKTWLLVIAGNIWRNWLRSRSAQKRSGTEVALENDDATDRSAPLDILATPQVGALQELLSIERYQLLLKELEGFPPRMRACFYLRFFQELPYKEVARVMDTSVETVKSQLFQARRRLRKILGDHFSEI